MTERFQALDEREKVGGGAVLVTAGTLLLALLIADPLQAQALEVLIALVAVVTMVIGVLSIGISQKTV